MSYAIIGSGAIGSALARAFARKNIDVGISNSREPSSLEPLAQSLGTSVRAIDIDQALRADIVMLAVPFDAVPNVALKSKGWSGRIVVDATNAIEFPAFKPKDLGGRFSTHIVAGLLSGARVVKAFNTIPAAILATDPAHAGGRRVLFLSGDDQAANNEISDLAHELGFAAVDLGKIAEGGRVQQFGGPVVAQNLIKID